MKKIYLFAAIMALITGIAVYSFASSLQKSKTGEQIPMANVVVAKTFIDKRTVISEDMLEVKQIPEMAKIPGTASSINDVAGKMTQHPIVQGEYIITSKLTNVGEKSDAGLAYELPVGKRAGSIDIGGTAGVDGYIREGDYIDLLATVKDSNTGLFKTQVVMEKVKVIRVGNAAETAAGGILTSYSSITLLLTIDEFIELQNHLQNGAIRAVLRPALEN